MKRVIDISEEAFNLLNNGGVDWLGAEHILDAVANGTPLEECDTEDCTNGDMIKAMFPNLEYKEDGNSTTLYFDKKIGTIVTHDWWNAPYKGNIYPKSDRPSGTWLQCGQGVWECSNCGNGIVISEQWLYKHHKYCGKCGAEME